MFRVSVFISIFIICLRDAVVCPPVTEIPKTSETTDEAGGKDEKLGLEYERYLKEVVGILESDETFRKKLEESNISDIKSGEIAKHLDFVGHGIRTQLDEIKRKEIDRLRQVMRLKGFLQKGLRSSYPGIVLPELDKEKILGHLDHSNPNTFEVSDLAKLIIQATQDLEDVDKKRKEEFKRYEMEKEMLRREQLKGLDDTHRKEAEKKQEEMQKKHDDHPKLHHPGNEEQLKEVWEESDGLNKRDFDPKTFFHLHDTNGDGFLDLTEVEALFQKELDKVYDPDAPEDDMVERYEEMNRMREHLVEEVDVNKDRLISLEEFIDSTKSDAYRKEEGWQSIDKETVFSEEEFARFQENYEQLRVDQKHNPRGEHQEVGGDRHEPLQRVAVGEHQQPYDNIVLPDGRQPVQQQQPAEHPVFQQEPVQQAVVHHEQPVQQGSPEGHQDPQAVHFVPQHIEPQVAHDQQQPVVAFQQQQQPADVPQQPQGQQPQGQQVQGQQVQGHVEA